MTTSGRWPRNTKRGRRPLNTYGTFRLARTEKALPPASNVTINTAFPVTALLGKTCLWGHGIVLLALMGNEPLLVFKPKRLARETYLVFQKGSGQLRLMESPGTNIF